MAEEAKKEVKPVYLVENVVRRVGTRLHRAMSARRHRWQLWLAGQRLLRNKKMPLTEEQFRKEEAKIKEMILAGQLALITPENIKVTATPTGEFLLTKLGTGANKLLQKGELPSCFGRSDSMVKGPEKTPQPPKEPEVETKPDDLTVLPSIGSGRARKLEANGISAYHQVVELGVSGLVDLLGVSEEVAEEIVEKATELS